MSYRCVVITRDSDSHICLFPGIHLRKSSHYEIACLHVSFLNIIHNANASNNRLYYYEGGDEIEILKFFTIKPGNYTFESLTRYINVEFPKDKLNFFLDSNTNRCSIDARGIFPEFDKEDSVLALFGFPNRATVFTQRDIKATTNDYFYTSELPVSLPDVREIFLTCNLVQHSYKNRFFSRILYPFAVTSPHNSPFVNTVRHPLYLPISDSVHHIIDLHLRLEDQDGRLIDLVDHQITITLRIRENNSSSSL